MAALSSTTGKHKLTSEETSSATSVKRARTETPSSCHPHLLRMHEMILKLNSSPLESVTPALSLSSLLVTRVEGERKEREVKEREAKVAAAVPLATTAVDVKPFDDLFKEIDQETLAMPANQALFRRICMIAIQGNQLKVIELLNRHCAISSLEVPFSDEILSGESFAPLNLENILKGTHLETVKKVVSLGFVFKEMALETKTACCFKAIQSSDVLGFLYLMEQLKLNYETTTPQGTLFNTLLLENLEMAKKVFESTPLPIPAVTKEHPFIVAWKEKKLDVARFIAAKLPLNAPGESRTHFLKSMLLPIWQKDVELLKFCVECGISFESTVEPLPKVLNQSTLCAFLRKYPHLLAHALLAGHEELVPLLSNRSNIENINLNMLALSVIALTNPAGSHMAGFQKAILKCIELGGNINYTLHLAEGKDEYTLFRLVLGRFSTYGKPLEFDERGYALLAEQVLFVVRQGAYPIVKIGAEGKDFDSIMLINNLRITNPLNIKFIADFPMAIPEAQAFSVLSRMFLKLVHSPSVPDVFIPLEKRFRPLFLRLLLLLFRDFPTEDELLLKTICEHIYANVSLLTQPHFEDKSLFLYALEKASFALKTRGVTKGMELAMKGLLPSTDKAMPIVDASYNADPHNVFVAYQAFSWNVCDTPLGKFRFDCRAPDEMLASADLIDKRNLECLLRVHKREHKFAMLNQLRWQFSSKIVESLLKDESWRKIASRGELEETYTLLNYRTATSKPFAGISPIGELFHKNLEDWRLGVSSDVLSHRKILKSEQIYYLFAISRLCRSEFAFQPFAMSFDVRIDPSVLSPMIDEIKAAFQKKYSSPLLVDFFSRVILSARELGTAGDIFLTVAKRLLGKTQWKEEEYKKRAAALLKVASELFISSEAKGKEMASERPAFEAVWERFKELSEADFKDISLFFGQERTCFSIEDHKEAFRSSYEAQALSLEKLRELIDDFSGYYRLMSYCNEIFDKDRLLKSAALRAFLLAEGLIVPTDKFMRKKKGALAVSSEDSGAALERAIRKELSFLESQEPQRAEEKARGEEETKELLAAPPIPLEFQEHLKVLNETPSISGLSLEQMERVKKSVFAILAHKIPLKNKKILVDVAKLGSDSKTQCDYWLYAISQRDQKMALELLECKMPLTLRLSGQTLLEKLLMEDLEFAGTIFKERPLLKNPKMVKHVFQLIFHFLENKHLPQVKFLIKQLAKIKLRQMGKIFNAVNGYIAACNQERLKFLFNEFPLVLQAKETTLPAGHIYSQEEVLKGRAGEHKFYPLILALKERERGLYPLLQFDDRNIAVNLYAYLKQVLQAGDIEAIRGLSRVVDTALRLARSPDGVLSEKFTTRICEGGAAAQRVTTIEFNLFSRTMYEMMKGISSRGSVEAEGRIEALRGFLLFLSKRYHFLNEIYSTSEGASICEILLARPEYFSDDFIKQLLDVTLKQASEQGTAILDLLKRLLISLHYNQKQEPASPYLVRKDLLIRCCSPQDLIEALLDPDDALVEMLIGPKEEMRCLELEQLSEILTIYSGLDLNALKFQGEPLLFYLLNRAEEARPDIHPCYLDEIFSGRNFRLNSIATSLLLNLLKNHRKYGLDLEIRDPAKGAFLAYARSKIEEMEKHLDLPDPEKQGLFEALCDLVRKGNSIK